MKIAKWLIKKPVTAVKTAIMLLVAGWLIFLIFVRIPDAFGETMIQEAQIIGVLWLLLGFIGVLFVAKPTRFDHQVLMFFAFSCIFLPVLVGMKVVDFLTSIEDKEDEE